MTRKIFLDIETTGLSGYHHRITCIGMIIVDWNGDETKKTICHEDEQELLKEFVEILNESSYTEIITWNGSRFDIPFLELRLMKYGMKTTDVMRLLNESYDIREDFPKQQIMYANVGSFRCPSLSEVAMFLDLPINKTANGKQAIQLWLDKKYKELCDYCLHDVEVLKAVYDIAKFNEVRL